MTFFAYNEAPAPVVPLNNHCSVIYNSNGVDTLYTFQQDAFQSLPLKSSGKWSKLPMGTAVNGAKCVLGQWNHQDALIVVGGTGVAGTPADYPGLQYFTFGSNQWGQIPSTGSWPTKNRQMHNAVFLNSSNSLVIHSGFQDNSNKQSSETFTMTAEPPYNLESHTAGTPTGQNPILLPWNASHAIMTGGSAANHAFWLFSKEAGWREIGVQANAVPDMTQVSATVLDGASGAKAIQFFNLAAVPNTVTNVIVQAADGNPHTRRQINVNALPAYNASSASQTNRQGYSLAQSRSTGMVVGSGGAGDLASTLVLFDPSENSWVAPQNFFSIQLNTNLQSASTGSSTSTSSSTSATSSASSATSTATTTATAATTAGLTNTSAAPSPSSTVTTGGDGFSDSGRTILGAVLGGLAGAGALLILLLLCLRWRKLKRRARGQAYHKETKNQMGFDDSDAIAEFNRSASQASKVAHKDKWERMPTAQEKLGVTISKPNLIYDSSSPVSSSHGLREPLIASTLPPTSSTKSDDGWNQYFSKSAGGNSALTPPAAAAGHPRLDSASHQTKYTMSNYDHESHSAEIYQDHDTAPLNPRSSGYPQSEESWEQSKLHPTTTTRGHFRGPSSNYASTIMEGDEPESFLHSSSSGAVGTQAWDSLSPSDGRSGFSRRPTSSIYTDSISYPHPGEKVHVPGDERSSVDTAAGIKGSQGSDGRGMRTLVGKDITGSGALGGQGKKDDLSWLNLRKS